MSQLVTMIIFAVAAVVVLYQLYAVLGRRVGRQPEDVKAERTTPATPAPTEDLIVEGQVIPPTGAAAIKARDPAFDIARFLNGARNAYEMIVKAFAEGDRETLRDLLAPNVMASFEQVIVEREAAGETQSVEFIHPPRGDLDGVSVENDIARIKVRFLAEHRIRAHTTAGDTVDDRRTAEIWTFERNLKSRDPNWLLVRVDAAEA